MKPAWIAVGLLTPMLALATVKWPSVDSRHWPHKYDEHFRKQSKHYFGPAYRWQWFKAQGIAESGLDPQAVSPTGAKGIMQILPSTFKEIKHRNPHFTDILTPRWNIAAGVYYDRLMYKRWKKKGIGPQDRLDFALASYTVGYGNILDAWKKASRETKEKVTRWEQVEPYAANQSRDYVNKIALIMQEDRSADD